MNKPFVGVRVLVVEDNAVNQQVARGFLEAMGCAVSVANDGEEAVRAIRSDAFDIIFMDYMMPKMDGLAATAEIRAHETASAAKKNVIIALTASALAGERERCLAAGMDAYLTKPFSRAALQGAMEPFLEKATIKEAVVPTAGNLDPRAIEAFRNGPGGSALLKQVIDAFDQTSPREWQTIHSAFSAGDLATLRRSAHTLKSSCAWLGGTTVVDLLRDIERAAAEGNINGVALQLSDAESAYEQFAHELAAYVGSPGQ